MGDVDGLDQEMGTQVRRGQSGQQIAGLVITWVRGKEDIFKFLRRITRVGRAFMLTQWWPERTRLLDGSKDDQSQVAVEGTKTINRGKKIYHGGRRPVSRNRAKFGRVILFSSCD